MANEVPILNGLLQSDMDCGGFALNNVGNIVLTAGNITLFQDPSLALHAASKQYVDAARFPLNELTDWADGAGQQAGSIILRNTADNGWTDGEAYLRWVDADKALRLIGAGPFQLDMRGGNVSGYNGWTMGGLGATSGVAITAIDTTASALPDRQMIHVDSAGILSLGDTNERLNLYSSFDPTNGYAINAFNNVFVEGAGPSLYLKQSAALGSYKYAELDYGSADRFRVFIENLNPPSVVTVLDLDVNSDTASFGAITTFLPNVIDQQTASNKALINLCRGEIYQNDTAATTALTLANTWYPVLTTWTDAANALGVTRTTATGRLTPTDAGVYLILWSIAGSVDSPNQQLEGCAYLNGTTEIPNSTNEDRFTTAGITYELGGQAIYAFNGTTDYVQIALNNNTSAGTTFTVDHATLTLIRLGG